MRKTVLHSWHIEHGATMTDFNGWHMPLYYRGITEEHLHARTKAGLFDLGHMGRVRTEGAGAMAFVDRLTPARVRGAKYLNHPPQADTEALRGGKRVESGEEKVEGGFGDVQSSFLLNERGRVIDDITIYYEAIDSILLVINAGGRERDLAWITMQASDSTDVRITDLSDEWGMVAIQGPNSQVVVQQLFGGMEMPNYYQFARYDDTIGPGLLIVSGTGYTGEHGYEFYLPQQNVPKLWNALLSVAPEAEVWPIGLGARDSLRLEAAMPLYGHELNEETTPVAAGLGKFVDLDKPEFIGREALLRQKQSGGPPHKLVAFEMKQRGPIARHGFSVRSVDCGKIGTVTSGIFSPTLQKVIGLAYVSAPDALVGNEIQIEVRGKLHPAIIVKKPFYKRST
jgi:aminomethyltransferase